MEEDEISNKDISIEYLKGIDTFVKGIFLLLLICFIVWLLQLLQIFK